MPMVSDRNIPLFYSPTTILRYRPIVTVENYLKWYNVYVIIPQESEYKIVKANEAYPKQWDSIEAEMAPLHKSFHGDHIWHPLGVQMFAEKIGGYVDDGAMAALVYRWFIQHNDKSLLDL